MTQVFSIFTDVILPILFIVTIGYVLQKLLKFGVSPLTKVIIYILIPCLIFSRIYRTALSFQEFAKVSAFSLAIIIIMGLFSYPLTRIRKYGASMRAAFALSIMFYNSANYGLPVIELVFSQNTLATSVQIMVLIIQNIITVTLGVFLVSKGQVSFRRSVGRTLRYPMIYAVTLAFVLRGLHISIWQPLMVSIERISAALVPMALITLGAHIATIRLTHRVVDIVISAAVRLLVGPLVALLFIKVFQFSGIVAGTLLISTSMPTAVNTALLAMEFKNESQFASQAVMFSTLLSIATVSFAIYGATALFM
jgi:predicted permease